MEYIWREADRRILTPHGMENGFGGTRVPLLAAWTGKDVGRGLPFHQLDDLQRERPFKFKFIYL